MKNFTIKIIEKKGRDKEEFTAYNLRSSLRYCYYNMVACKLIDETNKVCNQLDPEVSGFRDLGPASAVVQIQTLENLLYYLYLM